MVSKFTWLKTNLEIVKIFIKAAIFGWWNDWRERSPVWYWLAFNLYYFFNESIFISECLHIYPYAHCLLMLFVCYLFSNYPLHYFFIGATSLSNESRSNNWIMEKQINTILSIIIDNLHYILPFLEELFPNLMIKCST